MIGQLARNVQGNELPTKKKKGPYLLVEEHRVKLLPYFAMAD
jgi:hypothetical protein